MNDDVFKFLRIVAWALPAGLAYNTWGVKVALLTFGCQMFSAGPLTKIYVMVKARQGAVTPEEARVAYLLLNVMAGAAYAYFVHWLIGGEPPPPLSLGG